MKKWRFQVGFDTSYDGFGNGVGNAGASGTGWGHGRGNSSFGRVRAPPCLETP